MKAVQHDMTVGKPMKVIINFTLPIFIGNVFQQFYNMADAVIVGKFVGTKALAAVGSTGTIMFLIWGFVAGMTAGFTVLTAQKFGAGDMDGMRKTVAGAGILSLEIGLFLTIIFMAFMKPLLILMNTPEDIFRDAYAYIMIVSGGILAQMLYNLLSSILRALGNSKLPLYFLIISAVLNIFLDLLLIIVFGLGTAGSRHCNRCRTGNIGTSLPGLYHAEASDTASEKGGPARRRSDLPDADPHRSANGIAVFHYSDWNYDGADFAEYSRFYTGSGIYCGK